MSRNPFHQAAYAVVCDREASAHYDISPGRAWRVRVWVCGFVRGLFRVK